MRPSKSPTFLYLPSLFFFFLFPLAFSDNTVTESAFLFNFCSSFDNFTADSPYASNFNRVIHQLSSAAPPSGFAVATAGKDLQNQVNALALCRGDVSSPDCENCIKTAGREIQTRCPNRKGAVIWYDFCLLKYSNAKFFGKIDNQNKFYMWNVQEIDDPAPFNEKVKNLLSELSEKVEKSKELFVIGEEEIEDSKKLYGLVQCTRDLTNAGCKKCIDDAIGELSSCCDAKIGGRVVGGSCNFRYELYPIVDDQK